MAGRDGWDQILAAYSAELDRDLRARLNLERRLKKVMHAKAERNGYAGDLSAEVIVKRCYWPAVHQAALEHGVPFITHRPDITLSITVTTTESGAVRLRVELEKGSRD